MNSTTPSRSHVASITLVTLLLSMSTCINTLMCQELARVCTPGVVRITTPDGHGSGFIVSKDGVVVTNEHVIDYYAVGDIAVELRDGRRMPVKQIKRFNAFFGLDLAFLYCQAPSDITVLPIALNTPDPGTSVISIGHPANSTWLVSKGIISGIRNQDMLQHDAASNPGNSGGPLLDETGRVVGIVHSGDIDVESGSDFEGLNNAIRPERLLVALRTYAVQYQTERLIKTSKSALELANEDIREAQQRLSEDRARLDSTWTQLRKEKLAFDSISAQARVYNEKGMQIREGVLSEQRDLASKRDLLIRDRNALNLEKSEWEIELQEMQRKLNDINIELNNKQIPRLQGGVSGSAGYLDMKSDLYGSDHLLYRTEAYLAIRGGTNSAGHGADLYGISAAITSTTSIAGISYQAPIMTDVTFFVDFAERIRVEAGIGMSNGHPLFNHKNYLLARLRWNWSSSNSVCYGMYGSAMKSNGSDVIGLSAGLYLGLQVKFLRFYSYPQLCPAILS